MNAVANKPNNVVQFNQERRRKKSSAKGIVDHLSRIKPLRDQTEEIQKSSREAIREEYEDWD